MLVEVVVSDFSYPPQEGLHEQSVILIRTIATLGFQVKLHILCKDEDAVHLEGFLLELEKDVEVSIYEYSGSSLVLGLSNRVGFAQTGTLRRLGKVREMQTSRRSIVVLEGASACGLFRRSSSSMYVLSWIDPGSRRNFRLAQRGGGWGRRASHIAAAALFLLFEASVRSSHAVWHVVSRGDAKYLRNIHGPKQRVVSIPVARTNAVSAEASSPTCLGEDRGSPRASRLVIFADLRRRHMLDSTQEVLDSLNCGLSKELGVQISVLGRTQSGCDPLRAGNLSVEIIEWVEDLNAYLASADIVILPDLVGTGIKNRAVSALAAGAAVIGTNSAFEGIAVEDQYSALVCARGTHWSDLVEDLLVDEPKRLSIASNAPSVVAEFDERRVAGRWEELLVGLVEELESIDQLKKRGTR